MSTVDPRDNQVTLSDLVWRGPSWTNIPWSGPAITLGTTTNPPAASTFDTDKEAIDDLFPMEEEIRAETAPQGASTYFQGPPRYAGSCPAGQHDFELMPDETMASVLGARTRLVLYCHKCGTTVRHDISAPPDEESDDESLQDD